MTSTSLPTGTVSLLFSDIAGSTALLKRLGAAYAEALDGQRRVLRRAWADHGGTEMGTEGDSFFVVFPTAEGAASAATQAQRELAAFAWPGGEQVRVRMGVHTGTPTVHDGGYVGMDVHRAARIAGSAHGGQVVISAATAELVAACLPGGVTVKDLGSHQLKDLPTAEHLFQLVVAGLPAEFPTLKTLGAASSLPRPATPLVGRDGEVAELAALLGSPDVRLVTLTGPGGSGKTRLAIGVAEQLVDRFPDGVYFVPLAAVTTADVMWTSIAEVLDVPPEGRIPPGFFEHVAHRTALFVLDNLEQIPRADRVVSELLMAAPQALAIATSRRPLHVAAEHEHAVPPLQLPETASAEDAENSGAVQLFAQHARKVKASFAVTASNVADIVAVCRQLDGLPLAIELAAARIKLLTPAALLTRLDTALELKDTGVDRPTRQRTLRDTIGWSYDLLPSDQQVFFRRLGVFLGGADLDAVATVTSLDDDLPIDPLDMVAELVDANLVHVTESADGEPRLGMLETVRSYALDQLRAADELAVARERHAQHYVEVAEHLVPMLDGPQRAGTRVRFEAEHDNLREALTWCLEASLPPSNVLSCRVRMALRLCLSLHVFWQVSGYYAEARNWRERTLEVSSHVDDPDVARCLQQSCRALFTLGDLDMAYEHGAASVEMWKRLGGGVGLIRALNHTASVALERGDTVGARAMFEDAASLARDAGDRAELADVLGNYAFLEDTESNQQVALDLLDDAANIAKELDDPASELLYRHNMACLLREMGRFQEAQEKMRTLLPQALAANEPEFSIDCVEDYAAVLAEVDQLRDAARLFGAADAARERLALPAKPHQRTVTAGARSKAHRDLPVTEWEDAYGAGRRMTAEDALAEHL